MIRTPQIPKNAVGTGGIVLSLTKSIQGAMLILRRGLEIEDVSSPTTQPSVLMMEEIV